MNHDSSVAGLASLVQSRGRNGDSVLVHMSPEEVHGLQRVALAAGGSLTINPDTGLVEANFLKKLLPTLLGFGLNFLFPGLGAIGSGLLVGGVEAARTGDLGKGLMAGLGAFGGAGLGAGLSSAAQGGAAGLTGVTPTGVVPGTEAFRQAAAAAAPTSAAASFAPTAAASQMAQAGSFLSPVASPAATVARSAAEAAKGGIGSSLTQGVRALGSQAGRTAFMEAIPGGMAGIAAGGMGLANAMTPDYEQPDLTGEINDSYYQSYGYDPAQGRFLGGRFIKGYPGFPGYAEGGSVMPRPNYNYPQAGITRSSYAPSLDYTRPQEVVDGYEVKLDPFTGEERFADGGAVGVAPGAVAGDPMVNLTNTSYTAPALPPQQTLEQYYQGLLTPPPAQSYDPSFMNYMQSLNKFVTSPVAPPPPPPPKDTTTPPSDRTGPPGTRDKFDPSMIDFSKIDFNNFNFGDFMGGQYGDISQYMTGGDSRRVWDPTQGRFVTQTPTKTTGTTTGTTTTPTDTQNQYDPSKFDPSQYRYNPFEDGFNREYAYPNYQTDNIAYEDNAYMAEDVPQTPSDLSQYKFSPYVEGMGFGQNFQPPQNLYGSSFIAPLRSENVNPNIPAGQQTYGQAMMDYAGATPGFDMGSTEVAPQSFQYDFSGLGQMNQMGDMGGYGTQFQGFQPLPTDFGSTYQAPAMSMPTFDYSAYSPQQTDFGSMGNYGLGALGTTYAAPTFQMPSFDFGSQAAAVPTTSFQAPMTTGMDSTAATAPQFGFGNSDVLYGQTDFGMGGEQNIFGFASGGAIQRAAAGKLITGDGDGMSDDIRANIDGNQEARLADGEFVIPADVVSHLGNGSTDAGADQLHAMMDRVRKARTGRTRQAPEIDAEKYLLA